MVSIFTTNVNFLDRISKCPHRRTIRRHDETRWRVLACQKRVHQALPACGGALQRPKKSFKFASINCIFMKHILLYAAALLCCIGCRNEVVPTTVSIVPNPVSITQYEGGAAFKGVKTKVDGALQAEQYTLCVKNGRASICGGSEAGVFYGEQTLDQILSQCEGATVPNLYIEDKPYFAYRGALMDCCRHFFPLEDIKKFIDIMAVHKLNTLHWHLTDDQGWRIEIKKYPKLTEIGAFRKETIVGHYKKKDKVRTFDGVPHGGFYTQEECREIVAYAASKHITVIPEIEMPGHAVAALASYPELGCTGGPYEVRTMWGISRDVLCVGKDGTMQFLKDVLDEVCDIFPSEYINIGGDEAPRDAWKKCPHCQKRIADNGLEGEAQLQSWMIREVEKYLASKGRRIIGWDEILEGGIDKTATVLSWRGPEGGKTAAKMGNDAIMCPSKFFYFDYYETKGGEANGEHLSIRGWVNLRKAYSFDSFEDLTAEEAVHIKGVQANMWAEYTPTFEIEQRRMLPRFCALSEVAWNPMGRTSYEDFLARIAAGMRPIYDKYGYLYSTFAFDGIE